MKIFRHIHSAFVLAIVLAATLAICVNPAFAWVYHLKCHYVWDPSQNIRPPVVSRIDILYPGTPAPGIFTDVTIFPPFTHYETDGESYLYVFQSEPVDYTSYQGYVRVVTFSTILDFGMPGEPTPFTFVEYFPDGSQASGTIDNLEAEAVPTFSQWSLIALGVLLAGALAFMIHRRFTVRPAGA